MSLGYLDDYLALETDCFITSICYSRMGVSSYKWKLLRNRIKKLKEKLKFEN